MIGFLLGLVLSGSVATSAPEPFVIESPPATVDLRVAALLVSDQQGGPLPMVAAAYRTLPPADDSSSDSATTWIQVEIDGASLLDALAATSEETITVEIFAYLVGARLEVLDAVTLAVPLRAEDGPALGATGLRVPVHFQPSRAVDPGADSTSARVLVRVGDRFGLRGVDFVPTAEGPSLLEPRFAPTEPWIVARPRDAAPAPPSITALPVLAIGEPVDPDFEIVGEIGGDGARSVDRASVRLRLTHPDSPEDAPADTRDFVDVTIGPDSALPEIPPGRWRARLVVPGRDEIESPVAPSRPIDLLVVDGTAYAVPWPRLARLDRTTVAEETGGEVLLPDDVRDALEVLRTSWLEALAALPETGLEGGAEALRRLGVDAERALGAESGVHLARVQLEVFEALERELRRERENRDALVVLAVLPFELERIQAENRRHRQARQALDSALFLTRRLREKDLGRNRTMASILATVADRLQRQGFVNEAESLLREALDLDSTDALVRFALAAHHARRGRPADAAEEFARVRSGLVDGISNREVRLRRAVAERRAERRTDARAILRELVEAPGDDWIARLAHQELAILELELWRPEEAEAIARRAIGRFPDDPSARVLLARALTRQKRHAAAREVLLSIEPAPDVPSPRTRFNDWPTDSLAERRADLVRDAERHADTLAAAARRLLEDE